MTSQSAFNLRSGLEDAGLAIQADVDRSNWICAIDDGMGTSGTGILIGPDLVLTCYHVVRALYGAPERAQDATCRFGFMTAPGTVFVAEGRAVPFATSWMAELPRSSTSEKDGAGADFGYEPDLLDYAVIRLSEKVGEQGIDDPLDLGALHRGWMTIPDMATTPDEGPIWVLQHPMDPAKNQVMPQQRASGRVLKLIDNGLRLRHSATTYGGSSGGACFDEKHEFVALHNAGAKNEAWNQAVPIPEIVRHMRKEGFVHLIGVSPPRDRGRQQNLGQRVANQIEIDAKRKVHNAIMLMDRDDPENLINATRKAPNKGMVHLLACREVDSHANFIERLRHLSLDRLEDDERRQRQAILLGANGQDSRQPWDKANLDWPGPTMHPKRAMAALLDQVDSFLEKAHPIILEAVILLDEYSPDRDAALLEGIGKHLAKRKAEPERLQIVVVATDKAIQGEADRFKSQRRALADLWLDKSPPRCGASLELDDIGSVQLREWSEDMEAVFGFGDREIAKSVDLALPGGQRVSMVVAESGVRAVTGPILVKARLQSGGRNVV